MRSRVMNAYTTQVKGEQYIKNKMNESWLMHSVDDGDTVKGDLF